MAAAMGRHSEGQNVVVITKKSNKNYNTKFSPLPVDTSKLQGTSIMFSPFVCALLIFCACKFPAKSETRESRKIIVECTSYLVLYYSSQGYTTVLDSTERAKKTVLDSTALLFGPTA